MMFVSYQSALIPIRTTMATQVNKIKSLLPVRVRKGAAAKIVKPVVTGVGPVVTGIWPAPKSEKENFFNFGIQFKQLMAEETGEFDNWETLNKILKANNMRYCEESLKLLGQK